MKTDHVSVGAALALIHVADQGPDLGHAEGAGLTLVLDLGLIIVDLVPNSLDLVLDQEVGSLQAAVQVKAGARVLAIRDPTRHGHDQ